MLRNPVIPNWSLYNNLTQKSRLSHGAGDLVSESLRTLGFEVELIDLDTMTPGFSHLTRYLLGFGPNVLESLVYKNELLFDFAHQGGTLVVQYNTNRGLKTKKSFPIPLISHEIGLPMNMPR